MTSQIIELSVLNNKTVSSLKFVVDSARNRRRTKVDKPLTILSIISSLVKRSQRAKNAKSNNYSAEASPYGPAKAVVSFHSAELSVLNNKTGSSLKSIVDSAGIVDVHCSRLGRYLLVELFLLAVFI